MQSAGTGSQQWEEPAASLAGLQRSAEATDSAVGGKLTLQPKGESEQNWRILNPGSVLFQHAEYYSLD